MSEVIFPAGGFKNAGALIRAMVATLRSYWRQAEGYQKFLYFTGGLLLVSAVFHTGVLIVTGGSLAGDVSWRKPILFGEAFGLTALSLAWVMTFLPKRRVIGWLLLGTVGVAFLGETFLIGMQQWRGVPSHFNSSTSFDAAVFVTMGGLIVFVAVVITVVALWTFLSLQAPRSLTWAIRAGMVLLVVAQFFGHLIIANGGNTFGAAGAMKVPHALTLHAAQVLPLLGWLLLFTNWSESRRAQTVILGATAFTVLVAVYTFQTFTGRAPSDLSWPAALVLGISGAIFAAAYLVTLLALLRPAPHSAA